MKKLLIFENHEKHKKKEIIIGLKIKNISHSGNHVFVKKIKNPKSSIKNHISITNINFDTKLYAQECTTKVSYRKTKDLHIKNLAYIQKNGKGINNDNPELYGSDELNEYEKNMDELSWRIILSPENSNVDLNTLTKEFIKKLEEQTGYKLTWIAANHYDTAKHHTHIIINGKDKNGKEIHFRPEMIKNLMRTYSKQICTQMIGYKTENDINENLKDKIFSNSYTRIDRVIERFEKNGKIDNSYLEKDYSKTITDRLDYLLKLGLGQYNKAEHSYILNQNWKDELKIYGKYNTYITGFNYANVTPENYYLHNVNENGNIKGKLIKKFIMQKDSNNFAILLKQENGKVAYVPLPFYPNNCKINDNIEITIENKKTYVNRI